MDKLLRTTLYTYDTNINYNDLLKKLNVNLQLISEWLKKKSLCWIWIKHLQLTFHWLELDSYPKYNVNYVYVCETQILQLS